MKLTSKLSLGLLAAVAVSAAVAVPKAKAAVEMPPEIRGIYAAQKSECAVSVQEYKKNDQTPYLLINQKGVFWGYIASCVPKKVSGGNGVYKLQESCADAEDPVAIKVLVTYTIKGDVLTYASKSGSDTYQRCEAL